jgi:hypothetical protein
MAEQNQQPPELRWGNRKYFEYTRLPHGQIRYADDHDHHMLASRQPIRQIDHLLDPILQVSQDDKSKRPAGS